MADDALPAARASHEEREDAARALREHLVAGRVTLEEFSSRLDRVLAATTRQELDAVAADLPETPGEPARRGRRWIVAVMGGAKRRGRWRVSDGAHVVALMGGCDLDLRGAILDRPEVTLNCVAIMGGIQIVVPEGTDVDLAGFALMGGNESRVAEPRPGAPLVKVRALSLMGGVAVLSKPGRRRG